MIERAIKQQVKEDLRQWLDDYCNEFYEHIDGYENSSIDEIVDGIMRAIYEFPSYVTRQHVERIVIDANNDLEPVASDDSTD